MMNANMELYEKILDTPVFAFHFNELVKLAQSAAQQSGQADNELTNLFLKWLPKKEGKK